jgi:hypothetical protein
MLQFDLILVSGLVVLILSLPAIVSAVTENRAPRVAAIALLLGGAMIAYATTQKPGGYTLEDIPGAVLRVVAQLTK